MRVGAECRLGANVTLCQDVELGERVTIYPGAVIGADSFGIANDGVLDQNPAVRARDHR